MLSTWPEARGMLERGAATAQVSVGGLPAFAARHFKDFLILHLCAR